MIVVLTMLGTIGLLFGGVGAYSGLPFFNYGGFLLTGLVSLGVATLKNWYDQKELRALRAMVNPDYLKESERGSK